MIVWLASYPRSGNTLTRILLNRGFGIKTHSLYDDRHDIGARPALSNIVGHINHGMEPLQFCEYARKSDKIFFVKTHELPDDDAKTIYVVRDGRAAIVSYYHFSRFFSRPDTSLTDIVTGKDWPGAWSAHVDAWAPNRRPNTLKLRFEDLVTESTSALRRIAEFVGLPEPRNAPVHFSELHAEFPKFFRCGSNEENIAELTGEDLKLFWTLHGRTMQRMGYPDRDGIKTAA